MADLRRDGGDGEEVTENSRAGDNDQNHARDPRGLLQGSRETVPAQMPADRCDDDRSKGTDTGGFGRRKEPDKQPPHNQRKQKERFDQAGQRRDSFLQRRPGRRDAEIGIEPGPDQNGQDEKNSEQDARQHAGHEELADGLLRHDPVDNEDRAGRDQDSQTASGGDNPRGQRGIVPVFFHLRQCDGGHRCRRGAGRAADRRKPGAGSDRGDSQPPGEMSEKLVGRTEETAADPRMVGNLSHQNEQRDDRQVVGTEHRKEIPCDQVQGGTPGSQKAESKETDEGHDETYGNPGKHQNDEEGEADQACRDGRHRFTVRPAARMPSDKRTSTSSALPAATP